MRDLYHNFRAITSLEPTGRTSDASGTAVDMLGFDSCLVVIDFGDFGVNFNGSNYVEIQLEHSDDSTTWADVETADILRAETAAIANGTVYRPPNANLGNSPGVATVGYIGNKRYLRGVASYVGTHGAATSVSVVMLLGNASYRPVV